METRENPRQEASPPGAPETSPRGRVEAPASALPLRNLDAVRTLVVMAMGMGYASTLPLGPDHAELGRFVGYDPSWFGLHILFFLSGLLAWRSLSQGRGGFGYFRRRARRTLPVLALYTLAVVSLLYPALCQPGALDAGGIGRLGLYLVKTLTLVSPGGPMPGALEDAAYMCLLQGTVWTLRWGAVLHIATFIGYRLLGDRRHLLIASGVAVLAYAVVAALYMARPSALIETIAPLMRFGYAWALGACVWAWRGRLPRTAGCWGAVALILLGLAGAHHQFLAWSPVIDILATSGFAASALALLRLDTTVLRDWPPLALPLYLGVWPIGQTVLAVRPDLPLGLFIAVVLGIALALAYAVSRASRGVLRPPAASQLKRPRTA